jgi:hypothetical protein
LFIQSPRRLERDELASLHVPKTRFCGCVSLALCDRAASEKWHNRSQTLMTQMGQKRPNWTIPATSAFPPIATGQQTSPDVSNVPIPEVATVIIRVRLPQSGEGLFGKPSLSKTGMISFPSRTVRDAACNHLEGYFRRDAKSTLDLFFRSLSFAQFRQRCGHIKVVVR